MAYNDTPKPDEKLKDSQPLIRENFQLLEDSQVVDEGSTSDGDYIRYENGWQICRDEIVLEYDGDSKYCIKTWSFPQSFNSAPEVFANYKTGSAYVSHDELSALRCPSATSSEVLVVQYRVAGMTDFSEGDTVTVYVLSIGRWK